MTASDAELLQEFTRNRSEEAFTFLVSRHVNLVYSAALRQVGSSQLAEDVAQSVFVDLSRHADKLKPDTILTAWLYRVTRRTAIDVVRSESRRQLREQIAVELADMKSPDAPWKDIEPLLDEAMETLDEAERSSILLRYFENKSLREVGQALGVSDDTAQKRVSRAVEHLRKFFFKRGVAIGSTGFVAILSTNAVQAAPIGLITTISTAAALAGTTVATTATATTIQTVAMTTLQKTLVTATVAVLAGAGIYQTLQISRLRGLNHALDQQQTQLIDRFKQLQREHDDASNQLAMVNAENIQLKSGQKELLKLRGQVGVLRQQLVSSEAKSNSPLSGLEKIMADPLLKEITIQTSRREIKLRFAELFEELKLSPEQIETFGQTVANNGLGLGEGQAALTSIEVENRLRSLLGEAGFARYQEFWDEVPVRATLKLLKSQLGANQLTEAQTSRLWQIIKAEPLDLTYGIEGDTPEVLSKGSAEEVGHHLEQVAESNQRIAQQAGVFLTPTQLTALNTVLSNALKARVAQAATFQKR